MDLSKLTTGEKVVAGSGGLLFVLSFFSEWASIDAVIVSVGFSAWDTPPFTFLLTLAIILSLVATALVVARAVGAAIDLPSVVYVGLGGIATALILLTVLIGPRDPASRGILLFLGLILAGAQAYGGYLYMQEVISARPTGGPPSPPAPPPA